MNLHPHRWPMRAKVATLAALVAVPAVGMPIIVDRYRGDDTDGTAAPALSAPVEDHYEPDTPVRVNQVGYLPGGPKHATVVDDGQQPLAWQLKDNTGKVVAEGRTEPRGTDTSSGQRTHTVDFSDFRGKGTRFTLEVDGKASVPFDIGVGMYHALRADALSFYYPQRSGIAIDDKIAPGYGRAAGHVGKGPNQGDTKVPCATGTCDYTLDVTGGWYDAGDHGKYVVNGGVSVHQLMSLYERNPKASKDGDLRVPERGNKVPDVLDEARWQLQFMLKMQVPAGKPLAGMAHHKVHDVAWTALPTDPAADPQKRELRPPSTAATLNLAAVTAQGARLFEQYDKAFAAELRTASLAAWAAAERNPKMFAPDSDSTGGGAYGDTQVDDEFYWAAAELYLTTKDAKFAGFLHDSPLHAADVFAGGFDWRATGGLGRLQLATVDNDLPDRERIKASVVDAAKRHLATIAAQAYGQPYAPNGGYDWGSNSLMLNNLVVVATAYDLTGDVEFRDGVLQGMDYLLGRNALNRSYVTGYGEQHSKNQHSRWYANQLDKNLPNPPRGTLAGGPNSQLQDEVAAAQLKGCKPQLCYIDDIKSWSTNELTINWNSTLAWVSAFAADQGDATRT